MYSLENVKSKLWLSEELQKIFIGIIKIHFATNTNYHNNNNNIRN